MSTGNNNLDTAENLLAGAAKWCPCGSGNGMACDDWCTGGNFPYQIVDAIRLLIAEVRDLRTSLAAKNDQAA